MDKFKVGDIVKIKSLSWFEKNKTEKDNNYRVVLNGQEYFSHEMVQYCGKYATIQSSEHRTRDFKKYYLDIDNTSHYWTEGMFDNLRKDKLIKLNVSNESVNT